MRFFATYYLSIMCFRGWSDDSILFKQADLFFGEA
jgi:hypothetical protein